MTRRALAVVVVALAALVVLLPTSRAQADGVGGVGGDDPGDGYVASGSVLLDASFDGSAGDRGSAADCPGCRWALRTVCRPGEAPGEETCGAAAAGCLAGTTRMRLLVWTPGQPWWRLTGTLCVGPGSGVVEIDDVATLVRERVEEYLPALRPRSQPAGRTLAGLPTVLESGQPVSVGPVALDVLGHAVRLVAAPRWRWAFDDGTAFVTADPGRPWPEATVTHRFTTAGRTRVQVTATWAATFTVDGVGPLDVPPPPVTQSAVVELDVVEGRARLVG